MSKAAERLAKLEEQRARINAAIHQERAREQQQQRKDDTRRKIILGAILQAMVAEKEWPEAKLKARLDQQLERDADRLLFDLKPKEAPKTPAKGEQAEVNEADEA